MYKNEFSLYIHIPFCAAFCDYCDFYSIVAENSNAVMDGFVNAVIEDVKYQFDFFNVEKIVCAYIGGGTPSLLGEKRVRLLLGELEKLPGFEPVEFTIEANPESITEKLLTACLEGGINRLSLGVQSFHEPSRLAVNRNGKTSALEENLALVSRFFPGGFSADMITGLPYQTEEIVLSDIQKLLAFKPSHVSLYDLSVENGTPYERKISSGELPAPDRDKADALWLLGRNALLEAGFEHYEVSNFALPGEKCLHNMRYWLMDSWLGAGPAASGTVINEETASAGRFTFAPDAETYIKEPSVKKAVYEEINKTALLRESLLMGFRCREGPDARKFKLRFGLGIEDCIPKTLSRWKNRDIMLFLNSFLTEAFCELDADC